MSHALKEKPNAEELPQVGSAAILLGGRYLPPPANKGGKSWVRTSALIQASPQELYTLWRNIEEAPQWQEQITEVKLTGATTSTGHGLKATEQRGSPHPINGEPLYVD